MQYDRTVYVCDNCSEESVSKPGFPGIQAGQGWYELTQIDNCMGAINTTLHFCCVECMLEELKINYED